MPYIYADLEYMVKKINGCENNPGKSSAAKTGEHISCGYSISTIWSFNNIENKHTLCRGEDCMKMFCTFLRKHPTNVINFEEKMLTLTSRAKIASACDSMLHHSHGKLKDSQETRIVLLIFSLELEISGVAVQDIHQNSEKW